ncbi:alpha-1,6-mannosylglycoprotein 6-beta-N-acetylglucosaminyltransferase B-like [Engraulis encrasicolus]|uniref:alpha-1,6-mannosylglycoprotein 6-beta-N-acetylglucosaminyltransferase B-like n=1 Tax=Engraulis encrasicolus TaxID=184585 RepID=UPI002FD62A3E
MLERVHAYIQHQEFCGPQAPFPPQANGSQQAPWQQGGGSPFVTLPNTTLLGWAANASAAPCWPPLSALRLLVSEEGQSCVEACRVADLVCEAAFFRFVNNKEALVRLEVQCEAVESEVNHVFPAFSVPRRECGLQKDPLLFSCAGRSPKYRLVCPCRDYRAETAYDLPKARGRCGETAYDEERGEESGNLPTARGHCGETAYEERRVEASLQPGGAVESGDCQGQVALCRDCL